VASICSSNDKPSAKEGQPPKQEQAKEQPVNDASKAKGPTGFGPLKLGMTKEAVEALQPTEGVYLSVPMTPSKFNKYVSPKAGVERFDCSLVTPLSKDALETVLVFESGQLTEIFLVLDKSSNMLERVKNQIVDKYGPGRVEDTRKEKQCIYKNGANFKITSGDITTIWVENFSDAERVETRLSDTSLDACPSELKYRIEPTVVRSLTIHRFNSVEQVKSNNLF